MYYKGPLKNCEDYNSLICDQEGYSGTTTRWADIKSIDGAFYILKHPKYPNDELEVVEELPVKTIEI